MVVGGGGVKHDKKAGLPPSKIFYKPIGTYVIEFRFYRLFSYKQVLAASSLTKILSHWPPFGAKIPRDFQSLFRFENGGYNFGYSLLKQVFCAIAHRYSLK